jgi:hypothetical protein
MLKKIALLALVVSAFSAPSFAYRTKTVSGSVWGRHTEATARAAAWRFMHQLCRQSDMHVVVGSVAMNEVGRRNGYWYCDATATCRTLL